MYPYVICFCGRAVGDLYDAFKAIREQRMRAAAQDINPNMIPFASSLQIPMGDVLDDLGLTNECCRTRMITMAEIKEYY